MYFRSIYPKTIVILASMSLVLFAILALLNTYLFRNEFLKLWNNLEQPRILRIFEKLDHDFDENIDPQTIHTALEAMMFEFNLELFDRDEKWITGINSGLSGVVVEELSQNMRQEDHFATFSKIIYNPNPDSPFYAAKIKMKFKNTPVLNRVFFGFLLSGFFVIIVSSFVGWRLVSYLNKRLERLKVGVSKVSQGEFVRIEVDGKDEIAFLARSFNLMSQRIQKLVENLEESNAARQRLLAHASHEIKSPLTSVKGFIDIIEFMNVLSEDQQKGLLPVVKKDLNRVVKITNDMLQLTRLRDAQHNFDFRIINIRDFLVEEHSYFEHKASANEAAATLEINLEKATELKTDPERLSQILDNLWNNALKYGDLTQPIYTKLFTENNAIHIQISNHLTTKLDIPPERLFEPFYRNPATADKVAGSGLGLAIVRELTEKMGGQIQTRVTEEGIEIGLVFVASLTC